MANKKISELAVRTPSLTDLMLVGDPSTGYSYKATISSLSTLLEANIALDDLNDVTITSPTAGQVLSYNGTAWVNGTNGITGTGTTNYIPKFTSSSAIGNSQIFDNGTNVGIGTNSPSFKFDVYDASQTEVRFRSGVSDDVSLQLKNGSLADAAFGIETSGPYLSSGSNPIYFKFTSGTKKFIFTGLGALGVNMATVPDANLHVNGDVKINTIANATTDTDRFIVSDGGVIKYRTGSEVLSDIGGAAASSISGTTNYIPKFTSSSAIGNSQIFDNGSAVGIGTNTPTFFLDLQRAGGLGIRVQNTSNTDDAYLQATTTLGSALFGINAVGQYLYNGNAIPILFYTNGSERMRLDASGNLGLGTSSPTQLLSIQGNNPFIKIVNNSTTAGGLFWSGIADAYVVQVGSTDAIIPGTVAGSLAYRTANKSQIWSNDGGSSAAMTLDASGNLGLGVTPSAWGSTYKVIQYPAGFVGADGTLVIQMGQNHRWTGSANVYVNNGYASDYYQYNGSHVWQNAPSGTAGNTISFTQAMTLDASGRLGIGTTSPLVKLHVDGTGTQYIRVSSSDNATFQQIGAGVGGTFVEYKTLYRFVDTDAGEQMRITSGGNVGIGTISPAVKLDVIGNVRSSNSGATVYTEIQNDGIYATGTDLYLLAPSTKFMSFYTNSTERMRITSSGNVGIGTASPSVKLQVDNNTHNYFQLNSTVANVQTSISAQNTSSGNRATLSWEDGTRGAYGDIYASTFLTLSTGAGEKARLTSTGELLINTTSDAGDYKLQVNGNVLFGNTAGIKELRLRSTDNYAFANIWGGKTGDVAWLLMSGYPNNGDFTIRQDDVIDALIINKTTGNATFSGSIKTAAPSGGTAKPFKIGAAATVTPTSQNRTIEIEIDGTTYYLTAKTTND